MLTTPRPQAITTRNHMHAVQGMMRLGRLSSKRPSGARLRFVPGAFAGVAGRVPLQLDHRTIVGCSCALRESGAYIVIDFALDDRDVIQDGLLHRIQAAPDRWGFSMGFEADSLVKPIGGELIQDVFRVTRLREVSLTATPAICSHLFLKGC